MMAGNSQFASSDVVDVEGDSPRDSGDVRVRVRVGSPGCDAVGRGKG